MLQKVTLRTQLPSGRRHFDVYWSCVVDAPDGPRAGIKATEKFKQSPEYKERPIFNVFLVDGTVEADERAAYHQEQVNNMLDTEKLAADIKAKQHDLDAKKAADARAHEKAAEAIRRKQKLAAELIKAKTKE